MNLDQYRINRKFRLLLAGLFAESNQALAETALLDLAAWGYPLPSTLAKENPFYD